MNRHERAAVVARRQRVRHLILRGRVRLPRPQAVRLIGPDCAYHLYRQEPGVRSRPPRGRGR